MLEALDDEYLWQDSSQPCIFSDVGSKSGCAAQATRLEAASSYVVGLNQDVAKLIFYIIKVHTSITTTKEEDRNKQFNNRKLRMN